MKLLFDQNLSHRLVVLLKDEFPGSEHVRNLGMARSPDPVVWAYAAKNGFMIASKDTDFEQRALVFGHPPKVIWIRLGNCATSDVVDILRAHLPDLVRFEADPTESFIVLL